MKAVFVESFCEEDPAGAIVFGERPEPEVVEGWEIVRVHAAALNHHDVWSARGAGLRQELLPMILGCDAAGVTESGREVVVHAVVNDPSWTGDETLDPSLVLLSEGPQGAMAERVAVPTVNLIDKPRELSFEEACCLPTAWLTAYRMLFAKAELKPGNTVLVQGASGGLSTALVSLGVAAGLTVWVIGREQAKRDFAVENGAERAFPPGARLPRRVDAVMDSVGAATLAHSIRCLRPGGVVVVSGVTGGYAAEVDLPRLFRHNLRIVGSTMGTRSELRALLDFCVRHGIRPVIQEVRPLSEARSAVRRMASGEARGKIVLTPGKACPSFSPA